MFAGSYLNKALAERPDGVRHEAAPVEGEKTVQPHIHRRTIDITGPYLQFLKSKMVARIPSEAHMLQPTAVGALQMQAPVGYMNQPATSYTTKFVHVSSNKNRSSVNALSWTPEGRRCITGSHSGEFTLWNGTHFGFETIIQAHESPVRTMCFSHNDNYLLAGEDDGKIKYFKPNLEMIKQEGAHKEAVRGISFAPTDLKFVTGSDDSTVKIWDFRQCRTERVLTGHGGDVKSCDWHPSKALVASGSKDAQVKLWDVKAGKSISTLMGHHGTVSQVVWNKNGNWLLTASRDQSLKVFDVRMQREMQSYRGHNRDVICATWHPVHEDLFASGAYDGSLIIWQVASPHPEAEVRGAHEGMIYCLGWHPAGHVIATGSGDCSTKFWCRARPGDPWKDSLQRDQEQHAGSVGGEGNRQLPQLNQASANATLGSIPGIGMATAAPPVAHPRSELPPGLDDPYALDLQLPHQQPPPPPRHLQQAAQGPAQPFGQQPQQQYQAQQYGRLDPQQQQQQQYTAPVQGVHHHRPQMQQRISGWGNAHAGPQQMPGGAMRDNRKRDHGQAFPDEAHLQRPLGAPSDNYGHDVDPATGKPRFKSGWDQPPPGVQPSGPPQRRPLGGPHGVNSGFSSPRGIHRSPMHGQHSPPPRSRPSPSYEPMNTRPSPTYEPMVTLSQEAGSPQGQLHSERGGEQQGRRPRDNTRWR